RHQHRAATVNDFITRRGSSVRSDFDDLPVGHAQIARFDPRRIKLNKQCVAKECGHAIKIAEGQSSVWSRIKTSLTVLNLFPSDFARTTTCNASLVRLLPTDTTIPTSRGTRRVSSLISDESEIGMPPNEHLSTPCSSIDSMTRVGYCF